jgi:F420-dependent methylenetetrahydromethanopterin dehydrogenase
MIDEQGFKSCLLAHVPEKFVPLVAIARHDLVRVGADPWIGVRQEALDELPLATRDRDVEAKCAIDVSHGLSIR